MSTLRLLSTYSSGTYLEKKYIHYFLKNKFIYLFLAAVGLCYCEWAFSSCGEWAPHCGGFSFCGVRALERRFSSCGARA